MEVYKRLQQTPDDHALKIVHGDTRKQAVPYCDVGVGEQTLSDILPACIPPSRTLAVFRMDRSSPVSAAETAIGVTLDCATGIGFLTPLEDVVVSVWRKYHATAAGIIQGNRAGKGVD